MNLGNNLEMGYDNHDQTHKPRKPTGFNILILILLKINQKLYFIKRTNFNIFSLHQKQFKKNEGAYKTIESTSHQSYPY